MSQRKIAFSSFPFTNGLLYNYSQNQFPTNLFAWTEAKELNLKNHGSTYLGYVFEGDVQLKAAHNNYTLKTGQYFSINENLSLTGGKGIVIERIGYKGFNQIGGPVESWGRLRYIDGCTDSLLIAPVKLGDPCLNALFFPPNTDQTAHTHPSMRVGMVIAGQGECETPEGIHPLVPGQIFIIHEDGEHKFRTTGNSVLTVIAYHPDSDFGPQDEDHPMINRTIVNGISAAELDSIRTR